MTNVKSNIAVNLFHLRKVKRISQEELAEKIGVSRQAVAKWETGESLPDIVNSEALAAFFDVTLDDLVRYDEGPSGLPIAPKNKFIFGTVTVGERGQIVLPKKARATFDITPGTSMIVLGDTTPESAGIALVKSETFLQMTGHALDGFFKEEGEH